MAAFPTLATPPLAREFKEYYEDSTIRSPFDAGYEHTRSRYTRSRKIFEVSYSRMTNTNKESLETFKKTTVRGGADSFTWTHPKTGSTYTVRFKDLPKYILVTAVAYEWDVSFTLQEV